MMRSTFLSDTRRHVTISLTLTRQHTHTQKRGVREKNSFLFFFVFLFVSRARRWWWWTSSSSRSSSATSFESCRRRKRWENKLCRLVRRGWLLDLDYNIATDLKRRKRTTHTNRSALNELLLTPDDKVIEIIRLLLCRPFNGEKKMKKIYRNGQHNFKSDGLVTWHDLRFCRDVETSRERSGIRALYKLFAGFVMFFSFVLGNRYRSIWDCVCVCRKHEMIVYSKKTDTR